MGGSPREPGGCCAGGWPQPSHYPKERSHSLLCFPSYFPMSKPKNQPVPQESRPWPTQPLLALTGAPQAGSRGSQLGRAARSGAGTHLQRAFPEAEPASLPKPSDGEEEGSFRASPGMMGAPWRVSPGSPAPSLPAAACLIMRILTTLGSDHLHEFPLLHPPTPSRPGVCDEGTPKRHHTPKHGSAPTVTHTHTPSWLQATTGARLRVTALHPLFATESVPLVPPSLVLRPRQPAPPPLRHAPS